MTTAKTDYGMLGLLGIFVLAFFVMFCIIFAAEFIYSPADSLGAMVMRETDASIVIPPSAGPEYEKEERTSSVTSVNVPSPVNSSSYYTRTYPWTYGGYAQSVTLSIPAEYYDYYRNKSHTGKDFSHYALSEADRVFLGKMIDSFTELGEKNNFTECQNVMNVISFVQTMPYTSDLETTGFVEYPRYPIETLVDGGGDCEDSVILAAALLLEMGYDVVLIELSDHMALGIKGNEKSQGAYYEYNGNHYYYVETTSPGFACGEVPPQYANAHAKILPMKLTPKMNVSIHTDFLGYDHHYAYYRIHCNVTNEGPTAAQNVTVVLLAESSPFDMSHAWSESDKIVIGTLPDESSGWAEATLNVPRRHNTRFTAIVYGDNFNQEDAYTRVIYIH